MLKRIQSSAAFHARRLLLERRPEQSVTIPAGQALVSFTFDDFPASALDTGGAILERQGARGTFYWAGAQMRQQDSAVAGLTADHLRQVRERGHELGCHTYGHLDCVLTSPSALAEDLDRNQAEVAALLPGMPAFQHFAYPYGRASRATRAVVARRFATGRGVHHGVNRGTADLSLLRANPLYGAAAHYRRAMALIGEVRRHGGWLIFFTHDVSEQPGAYGALTLALERIVSAALDAGCTVLPVGAAAQQLQLVPELAA